MARYRRVQTVTHEIGAKGTLIIAVASADVRLTAVAGGTATIEATFEVNARDEAAADTVFDQAKMSVDAVPGRLRVAEEHWRGGLGGAIGELFAGKHVDLEEVEVTAPPGCRLEVRAVSGDVQATGFVGSQRYQTVSGDLQLADGGGGLDIDSVSGDVSIRAVQPVSMKVNTVSGDLRADAPRYDGLDANAVSGDVSVDGSLAAGVSHDVETVSGDLRLAVSGGVTVSVRGLSSDVHSSLPHRVEGGADRRRLIVGDGAASLGFTSMSGDLAVTRSRLGDAPVTTAPVAAPANTPAAAQPVDRLAVLGALERGEIDVDEAMRRLGDAG
jgi:DUF4097 and DUF4098 domain-containing protein YvlB